MACSAAGHGRGHGSGATAQADPENRSRRQYDRPRGREKPRHCRLQHAGNQQPGRGRNRAGALLPQLFTAAALRRLPAFDALTRRGEGWSWPDDWHGSLGEISGKTVGLVGFGAVPRLLAPILTAMGAKVIYTNRRQYQDVPYPYISKQQLLECADIVSLHLPLTELTEHWLDADAIAGLKTGAVVVNVARGGLIDEAALHRALASGHISAAGLDVHASEPAMADNPLFMLPQVAVTPHVAWLTRETLQRSIAVAVENCHRLARGDDLLHRVV